MSRRGLIRGAKRQMVKGDRIFDRSNDESVWRPAFDLSTQASLLISRVGPRYWNHYEQKWDRPMDLVALKLKRPDGSIDSDFEMNTATGEIGWAQAPCSPPIISVVSPMRDSILGITGWKSDLCNDKCGHHHSQISAATCAATELLERLAKVREP